MNILVIDNEEDIRLGCVEILALKGFKADTAPFGEEVKRMTTLKKYDIIVASEELPIDTGSVVVILPKPFTAKELIDAVGKGKGEFLK